MYILSPVEHVVVPLLVPLRHNAGLLQEVVRNVTSHDVTLVVEVDFYELTESARVVVPHSFSIPETLQQRISFHDSLFDVLATAPV